MLLAQFVCCITAREGVHSQICITFVRHVPPCSARFDLRTELTAHLKVVFLPAANFVSELLQLMNLLLTASSA